MADAIPVGVNVLVVPDGIRPRDGKLYLRLSLAVGPNVKDPPPPDPVDLRVWPREIAGRAQAVRIAYAEIVASGSGRAIDKARWLPDTARADVPPTFAEAATALWQRIFDDGSGRGFSSLREALLAEQVGPQPGETTTAHAPDGARRSFGAYSAADLGRAIDAIYAAQTARTLLERIDRDVRPVRPSSATDASAPLMDSGAPGVGWWRMLHRDWVGLAPLDDPVSWLAATHPTAVRAADTATPGPSGAAGAAARRLAIREMQDAARALRRDSASARAARAEVIDRADLAAKGLEGAAGFFRDHITDSSFWRTGRSSRLTRAAASSGNDAFLLEMGRFAECLGIGYGAAPPLMSLAGAASEDAEAAGRKLSAILSYPTLAKYLGLIVDVEVELTALIGSEPPLPSRTYGAVAAEFGNRLDFGGLHWTSTVLHRTTDRSYFGPCPRAQTVAKPEQVDAAEPFKDGVLDLTVPIAPGRPRFVVDTADTTNAAIGLAHHATDVVRSELHGRARSEISTKIPPLRSRGITLHDLGREKAAAAELTSAGSAPADPAEVINDAEDLVQGYRIDAAMATKALGWNTSHRWRPLVARDVHYGKDDVAPAFLEHESVRRTRDRDDGHVRPMTTETTVSDGTQPVHHITPHKQLFTWTGESLAVPALRHVTSGAVGEAADDGRVVSLDPKLDLAIDIEFDLPQASGHGQPDRRPVPLRELRGYVFGARLCLVNGCGLTFGEALPRYLAEPLVLGAAPRTPFVYRRRHEIDAPDVLLPWNDPVVTVPTAKEARTRVPGENIDTLVVRSGDFETARVRRFVVPPRATFDLAEQYGLFDENDERQPRGAFTGSHGLQLDPVLGTFPVAREGTWAFAQVDQGAGVGLAREPSRGSVLVLDGWVRPPETPFYPDPMARGVRARFGSTRSAAPGFDAASAVRHFWGGAGTAIDALPIVLEVRRAGSETGDRRGWFDNDDQSTIVIPHATGVPLRMRKLAIVLRAAEVADLTLWSEVDPSSAQGHHALSTAVDELVSLGRDRAGLVEKLPQALAEAPLDQLTNPRIVRVIHAVDRPLAPRFLYRSGKQGPVLHVHPVVLTVGGGEPRTGIPKPWADYVASHEGVEPAPDTWPSVEGGTTTFFVGAICVHRPSSGRVRIEAQWAEYGAKSVRRDEAAKVYRFDPPIQQAFLPIDDVSTEETVRLHDVDLLYDDEHRLRALSHAFVDGKARRLVLRLVATSRFTDYFPEDKSRDQNGVGRYERASGSFDVELRHDSAPDRGSVPNEGSPAEVWVPCTSRPVSPEVDRVLPLFRWTTTKSDDGRVIRATRESSLRIVLKGWHMSSAGEGEMLGVVFWPGENVGGVDLCQFDEMTGRYRDFLTRWGTDPIHLSGPLDDLVAPTVFSGWIAPAPALRLELDGAAPLSVAVRGYQPVLDPAEGLWYCDLDIDRRDAYFAFFQIGLVRYQPHAVSGLELSRPIATFAQVPPRRELRVVFKDHRQVVLEVRGIGYHRSNVGPEHQSQHNLTDVPLLNVRLVRTARADAMPRGRHHTIGWQPVLDRQGQPLEWLRLRPTVTGAEVAWVQDIVLPRSCFDRRYGLIVEEVELMAADTIQGAAGPPCAVGTISTTLVERGPLFSHVIDLAR